MIFIKILSLVDETGIMSNNMFTVEALDQLLGTPYKSLLLLTCTELRLLEQALLYNRVSLVVEIFKMEGGKIAIKVIGALLS